MFLQSVDSYSVKLVTMYCTFTCTYMPLLLLLIIYQNDLYNIGHYSTIYVPIIIVLAEFIKLFISFSIEDVTFGSKENKNKRNFSKVKIKEIFKSIGVIISIIGIYYVIAVMFGAPIILKYEETLMISILVSSLTVIPSCLNVGSNQTLSFLVGKPETSNLISDMILQYIQLTFVGTWLGAIVIPLDWDRPWQEWPVPCCIGAIGGYVFSHVVTLIKLLPNIIKVFTGKSFKFKLFNAKHKLSL